MQGTFRQEQLVHCLMPQFSCQPLAMRPVHYFLCFMLNIKLGIVCLYEMTRRAYCPLYHFQARRVEWRRFKRIMCSLRNDK